MKRAVDTAFMVILVIVLAILLWTLLDSVVGAQGEYWYLTTHYQWRWHRGRYRRITYPVVCNRYYTCKPACRNYYGGWGPCY